MKSLSVFRVIFPLVLHICWTNGEKKKEDMLNGMLDNMQQMLGQIGGGGPEMEQLKQMLGSVDTEKVGQFLQGLQAPENLFDWIPPKIRAFLPEEYRVKMGKILASELEPIGEVYNRLGEFGSLEEFWVGFKKQTPILVELLLDIWQSLKKRWATFEKMDQNKEAKEYMENLKSSAWEWIKNKAVGPFLRLSDDAKTSVKSSLTNAFPAVGSLVDKLMTNEKLREWVKQWQVMAELAEMFEKVKEPEPEAKKDKDGVEDKAQKGTVEEKEDEKKGGGEEEMDAQSMEQLLAGLQEMLKQMPGGEAGMEEMLKQMGGMDFDKMVDEGVASKEEEGVGGEAKDKEEAEGKKGEEEKAGAKDEL